MRRHTYPPQRITVCGWEFEATYEYDIWVLYEGMERIGASEDYDEILGWAAERAARNDAVMLPH